MSLVLSKNNKMNEGIWFEYDTEVAFKIRYLSPEKVRQLRKPHVKTKWVRGEQVETINDDAFNDSLNDYIIADWRGVESEPGKKADCSLENKKKLVDVNGDVTSFILEMAQNLYQFSIVEQEKQEKN